MVNEVAAHELELYTENTGELYPQRKRIIEQLKRKIAEGKYSEPAAVRLWAQWFDAAAKRYAREFASPGDWSQMFPKDLRLQLAKNWARYEHGRIKLGEWD